jgi:c-di-GMP-binding flagellar brake protein YcgR
MVAIIESVPVIKEIQPQPMRLDIDLGDRVIIKGDSPGQDLSCVLVGLEAPHYLIVRKPQSQVTRRFRAGEELVVRYVHQAEIYRFRATVTGQINDPAELLFISYPDLVEDGEERKSVRVSCEIPATASIDKAMLNGLITDISSQGCRFIVNLPGGIQPYQVKVLTDVNLSIALQDQAPPQELSGRVRNTNIDRFRIALGIEFEKLSDRIADSLKAYVDRSGCLR